MDVVVVVVYLQCLNTAMGKASTVRLAVFVFESSFATLPNLDVNARSLQRPSSQPFSCLILKKFCSEWSSVCMIYIFSLTDNII